MNTVLLIVAIIAVAAWFFTRPDKEAKPLEVEACTQSNTKVQALSADVETRFKNWQSNVETSFSQLEQRILQHLQQNEKRAAKELSEIKAHIDAKDYKHQLDAIELELQRIKEKQVRMEAALKPPVQRIVFPKGVPVYMTKPPKKKKVEEPKPEQK